MSSEIVHWTILDVRRLAFRSPKAAGFASARSQADQWWNVERLISILVMNVNDKELERDIPVRSKSPSVRGSISYARIGLAAADRNVPAPPR